MTVDKDALEEQSVVAHIRALMKLPEGRAVFQYLIKTGKVAEAPGLILDEKLMYHNLGVIEYSHTIFNLMVKADPAVAASMLTNVKKEILNVQASIDEARR